MSRLMAMSLAATLLTASGLARQTASPVHVRFDLRSPDRSPFPSDRFTVADASQNTGRRVNLPPPSDCGTQASECEDLAVLNQLDGFNMQARISVPFSGAIDPSSVSSRTVFLLKLGDTRAANNAKVEINYIVWDPDTLELSFRPDLILDQHTRYALVVTSGVRDAAGNSIGAEEFRRYLQDRSSDPDRAYQQALRDADAAARQAIASDRSLDIAALSVFTTQSFSHLIERMRDAVNRAPAPTLNFGVGRSSARAVFNAADIQTLTNNTDVNVNGPLTSQPLGAGFASMRTIPGAVGTVAFGTFRALDFTIRPSGHVPPVATRTGAVTPAGTVDVAFDVWLPSGPKPAAGWPIAIFGHGSSAGKNVGFASAAVLASHGLAVVAIHGMAHGTGPRTTMTAGLRDGSAVTFASPGLGYDADGDGAIAAFEPRRPGRPFGVFASSGTIAQTVAQHLQLVRAIQAGVDVDGDGRRDLDSSRIYYYGHSLGSSWGMPLFVLEPAVRAAAFIVPPGTLAYNNILSPGFRTQFGETLGQRSPSLLNAAHGLKSLDGIATTAPYFNENLPLRNQPPIVNAVPGAAGIQRVIDRYAWTAQITNTVAWATLLRRSTPRPFIVQAARSDTASTNPPVSELIRAGDFASRVFLYRNDLNFGNDGVPANPHAFLTSATAPPGYARVASGAQQQIATFFETDGRSIIAPTPAELWEAPIRTPLDDLFLLPRPR